MTLLPSYRFTRIFAAAVLAFSFSAGSNADSNDSQPRIQVVGEGSVGIAPDMAVLELAVTREAATAREALDANSSAMGTVLAAMQAKGIEERDLQTSKFSIQPKYFYPPQTSAAERPAPRIVGYTVRNRLTVRVRDIASVGAILDESVTLGVNEGGNIRFTNDDPSAAISRARIAAVKDAMSRADTLAEAAGVKTGKILEISEQSRAPRAAPMARAEMMRASSADAVPVAAGENTYRVVVNIALAIEQS